jgi:CRISPR/Cas system-associated exonuclease Cas4 (RecB family)
MRSQLSSLEKTSFLQFGNHSIPVHVLSEYWYCAAQITNLKLQGEIETPILLEGSAIHEEWAQRALAKLGRIRHVEIKTVFDAMLFSYMNIKRALKKKSVLANAEGRLLFATILPELGVFGKPDQLDCTDGTNPIIVEIKTKESLPARAWPNDELQVGAYVLGLERLGFHPTHGLLEYVVRGNQSDQLAFRIEMKDRLRKKIVETAAIVRRLLLDKEEPIPTKNPRKCVKCRFARACAWKPNQFSTTTVRL